jgi:hypothetical protein
MAFTYSPNFVIPPDVHQLATTSSPSGG